jgi:hypothetical protein
MSREELIEGMNSGELPFGSELPFGVGEEPSLRKLGRSLSSLFNPGESIVKNARFILTDLPVKAAEANKVLPFGLRLTHPPTARLFVVSYEKAAYCGTYNEAALIFYVKTWFGEGGHMSWMVVNDDTALIVGREVLACPKKMADISYRWDDNGVTAGVVRRGTEVISIEAEIGKEEREPGFVFGSKAFNVGALGQFFMLNPIWCFKLEELIYESYTAEGSLTLHESVYDPIKTYVADYPDPVSMRVVRMDVNQLRYMLPVGLAGIGWFTRTYDMRFR